MATRSPMLGGALRLLGSSALPVLLTVLLTLFVGRVLGPEGLGIYSITLAWIVPLGIIVEAGLASLITQETARDRREAGRYLRAAFRAQLLIGLSVALLLAAGASWVTPSDRVSAALRLAIPLVLLVPLYSSLAGVFRGRRLPGPLWAFPIGTPAFQLAATLFVLSMGGGVQQVIAVNVGIAAIRLVLAWLLYRFRYSEGERGDSPNLKHLLRRGRPFLLGALILGLQIRLSMVYLDWFADRGEAGFFSAASRCVEVGRLIPSAVLGALLPALAGLAARPADLNRVFSGLSMAIFVYAGLLGLAGTFWSDEIIQALFGTGFAPAAPVLLIALWGLVPFLLRSVQVLRQSALGNHKWVTGVNLAVLPLHGALSVWLIRRQGAEGAALAILATELAAFLLLLRKPSAS